VKRGFLFENRAERALECEGKRSGLMMAYFSTNEYRRKK